MSLLGLTQLSYGRPCNVPVRLIMALGNHPEKRQSVWLEQPAPTPEPGKTLFGSSAPRRSWLKAMASTDRVSTNRTATVREWTTVYRARSSTQEWIPVYSSMNDPSPSSPVARAGQKQHSRRDHQFVDRRLNSWSRHRTRVLPGTDSLVELAGLSSSWRPAGVRLSRVRTDWGIHGGSYRCSAGRSPPANQG
jgi:hypothetical protein